MRSVADVLPADGIRLGLAATDKWDFGFVLRPQIDSGEFRCFGLPEQKGIATKKNKRHKSYLNLL